MKKVVILAGMSSAGKDIVQKELIKHSYTELVSHTSRPMRHGEIDGVNYHFISNDDVDKIAFIESRWYHTKFNGIDADWFYGLSVTELINKINTNDKIVVVLDLTGAKIVRDYCVQNKIECELVYIKSNFILRTIRAIKRGSFSSKEWIRRLFADRRDFKSAIKMADKVIVNRMNTTIEDMVNKIV